MPQEFVEAGTDYEAEVLAIEATGNQTSSEIPFGTEWSERGPVAGGTP